MMNRLIFIFAILPQICIAQFNNQIEKLILNGKIGYFCKVKNADKSILLTRFSIESSQRDSIYIFDKPSGMFKEHPLVWDVKDSTIFQVRIYTSGDGMQYSELRAYKENKIRQYSNEHTGYDYIGTKETLLDNSLPLNSYISRIHKQEDTLKGPLYFDIIATDDSLLLYIYIHDSKIIEVWNFSRYALLMNKIDLENGKEIMKKKKWELIKSIKAQVSSPFQVMLLNNKIFALTYSGDLLDLSNSVVQKVRSYPVREQRGLIIVDKKLSTTKYTKTKNWNPSKNSLRNIIRSSKYIRT
jgi:hypothetical protein